MAQKLHLILSLSKDALLRVQAPETWIHLGPTRTCIAAMLPVGWLGLRPRPNLRPHRLARGTPLPIPLLYAATVLVWGLSWYAMEMQLVLPGELAIVYRFLLATAIQIGRAHV